MKIRRTILIATISLCAGALFAASRIGIRSDRHIGVDGNRKIHRMDNAIYNDCFLWYPFDAANATQPDLSRFKTSGAVTNATWSSDGGGCYDFDGTNDFINVGTNSDASLTALTMATWAFPDLGVGTFAVAGSSISKSRQRIQTANGVPQFVFKDAATARTIAASTYIFDTNWHHIACVFNGANTSAYVYVDGILEGNGPASATMQVGSGKWYIGGENDDGALTTPFNGKLDGFRSWNSVLTSNQIYQMVIGDPH